MSEKEVKITTKAIFQTFHKRVTKNGSNFSSALIHVWAYDRYDDDDEFYEDDENEFLRGNDFDEEIDAQETLQFLVANGADIRARASDMQTVLHMAMARGRLSVLKALMRQFDFTIDDFKLLNQDGLTPLHVAIHEGHIDCFELLMETCPPEHYHSILDSKKNSLLMELCRFTDADYGGGGEARTLKALEKLLKTANELKMVEIFTQENDQGHNLLCVAAKYGVFHEVEVISKVEMGIDRPIGNKCGSHGYSPLELARRTLLCLEDSIKARSKNERRDLILGLFSDPVDAPGMDPYIKDTRLLKSWHSSTEKIVLHLLGLQTPLPVTLDDICNARPGSVVAEGQCLEAEAEALKQELGRPFISKYFDNIWILRCPVL